MKESLGAWYQNIIKSKFVKTMDFMAWSNLEQKVKKRETRPLAATCSREVDGAKGWGDWKALWIVGGKYLTPDTTIEFSSETC